MSVQGCEWYRVALAGGAMEAVDMNTVTVVWSGGKWPHETPPCCRGMIRYLEKNESMVTWLQVYCARY